MTHQALLRSVVLAALAAPFTFAATTLPPIIYSVVWDLPHNQIDISGQNFSPFGGNPLVQLGGGTYLVLEQYGNSYIVADLPTALVVGETYDLIITQGTLVSSPFGIVYGAAGPQGPQGPAGPAGPQGPAGPKGATGATGAVGSQGPTGAQGPQGPQGATGPAGPAGPAGLTWKGTWSSSSTYNLGNAVSYNGSSYVSLINNNKNQVPASSSNWSLLAQQGTQGVVGPTGATGPQGPKGATGAQGPQGTSGAQGPQGNPGANGNTVWNGTTTPPATLGVNGDFYLNTATHCLYGPKTSGAWPGTCVSVIGPQGATGAQGPQGATGAQGPKGAQGTTGAQGPQGNPGTNGNTVWNGTATPPSTLGANGDFYLNTATHCLYGPKTSGAWPGSCVSVIGPQGATGAQGPQGGTGPQGPQGATGSQGSQGPQGNPGTNGNTVWNGTATPPSTLGANGDFYLNTATHCLYGPKTSGAWPGTCVTLVGPQGATGAQGPQGGTGSQGPQGPQGATGSQGTQGPQGNPGTNGNTVWNGTATPPSTLGANGDFYLNTATHCLYGPKTSGAWPGTCVTLVGPQGATGAQGPQGGTGSQGPQGPQGATGSQGTQGPQGNPGTNGNTVWNGTATPPSTLGANGDFYLNTATHCLYGPKTSGAWPGTCVTLVGPQGTTGAQGPQGGTGPQGPQGPQGATGSQGTQGPQGNPGTNGNTVWNGTATPPSTLGANGDFYLNTATHCLYGPKTSGAWPGTCVTLVGPQGTTGAQGPQGGTGPQGPQGPQGATGSQGTQGPQGNPGTNGNTVWNGTATPPSTLGANGDFYLNTATHCLYGPKASGSWPGTCVTLVGPQGSQGVAGPQGPAGPVGATGATGGQGPQGTPGVEGPQGPAGANGNALLNGTAAPTPAIGNNGDFYLNTVANCLYGPKVSGAWPATCATLVGPQGAQGVAGPQGTAGPQGVTGATGASGPQGPAGPSGPAGATGAQGPAGMNGNTVWNGTTAPNSNIGVNGDFYLNTATNCLYGPLTAAGWQQSCVTLVGPQGVQGVAGPQGPVGAAGPQGPQGNTGATGQSGPAGPTGPQGPAGPPVILSGFCGTSTGLLSVGVTTGVLLELGSEDVSQPSCNNGYAATGVVGVPIPSAGTLQNLRVASSAGSSFTSASYQIQAQVWVNGVQTPVMCTFSAGSSCADGADTYAVNPGDAVAVQLVFTSGAPVPVGQLSIHASLEKQ